MDRAKSERALFRRRFTLCVQKLNSFLESKERTSVSAEFDKLSKLYEDLCVVQNKVINFWLDEERDEGMFEKDVDAADEYDTQWYIMKQNVSEFLNISEKSQSLSSKKTVIGNDSDSQKSSKENRRFRLPKLELTKFNGEVKSWICFWSQFKKIDADESIDYDDKFQYLLQCIERGTVARELVDSFPPSGDNYHKVIEQLKQRFAKDEIIIEHYVRELLHLVLAQAKGNNKMSIRSLYDNLMTQIMALETMGVTQDKYAAFLLPLVESALPEDILKAWSRSHFYSGQQGSTLSKLLAFVRLEVETEERIRLAHSSLSRDTSNNAIPTASCFATSEKKNDKSSHMKNTFKDVSEKASKSCLWCGKTSHASSECIVAMKNACMICLNIGHIWKKCRKYPKCVVCEKRHYPIMCSDLVKKTPSGNDVKRNSENNEAVMSTSSSKTVLLQTLKVNILSDNGVHTVRALLDSGAQRSFIKSDIAENFKLKPIGQQETSHVVFGGSTTEKRMHKVYNLFMKKLSDDLKKRFRIEYLSLLVQKPNKGNIHELKIGDIVIVGSDNTKRVNWPLGVILELYPGADGNNRVARLKTAVGERIRPLQRLFPLEISRNDPAIPPEINFSPQGSVHTSPDGHIRPQAYTRTGRLVKPPCRLDL